MIDLHYWPTPNGWKISIMLEECGLPYTLKPVNIGRGEQFKPGVPRHQPEQPHAGHRRPRSAGRRRAAGDVRERRDPDLSGREDRPLPARRPARPRHARSHG